MMVYLAPLSQDDNFGLRACVKWIFWELSAAVCISEYLSLQRSIVRRCWRYFCYIYPLSKYWLNDTPVMIPRWMRQVHPVPLLGWWRRQPSDHVVWSAVRAGCGSTLQRYWPSSVGMEHDRGSEKEGCKRARQRQCLWYGVGEGQEYVTDRVNQPLQRLGGERDHQRTAAGHRAGQVFWRPRT